jgi:hypothetical protein
MPTITQDPMGRSDWHDDFLNRIPLANTGYKVDIDDPMGAQIRIHPSGMSIYMLHRNPGYYLNDHNRVVPEKLAGEAGFDIERWAKVRAKKAAMSKAARAGEAEYDITEVAQVVWETESYRVVQLGNGFCNVEFVDGDIPESHAGRYTLLNTRGPLSRDAARQLFDDISRPEGREVSASADASQPADADVDTSRRGKAK